MQKHVHIGVSHFIITSCYVIEFAILWRVIATRYSDTPWGKAMAFIF